MRTSELDRIAGLEPPANAPRCAFCRAADWRGGVKVLAFSLVRNEKRPDGLRTSHDAGGIKLCERCWRQATGQKRKHRPARCHPDRAVFARGMCGACYRQARTVVAA